MIKILSLLFLFFNLFAEDDVLLMLDTKGHMNLIVDMIVTKEGDIITASKDTTIRIWDSSGNLKRKILGEIDSELKYGRIYAIALSPDEHYLAVGGFMAKNGDNVGDIRIYNYKTGKLVKLLHSHRQVIEALSFGKDGRYLISSSADGQTSIWNVKKKFYLEDTVSYDYHIMANTVIKKDSDYVVISAGYIHDAGYKTDLQNIGRISAYSLKKKKNIKTLQTNGAIFDIALSNKHIAIANQTDGTKIYDFNLNLIKSINNYDQAFSLAYSKDGKYLVVGCFHSILVYKADARYIKKTSFVAYDDILDAVGFLNSSTALSAGGIHNQINFLDINKGKIKRTIRGDGDTINSMALGANAIAFGYTPCERNIVNCKKIEKSIDLDSFIIKAKIDKTKNFHTISIKNGDYTLETEYGGAYNTSDGKLVIKKNNHTVATIWRTEYSGYAHSVFGWYKDYIVSGGLNGRLSIYNKKGKEIAILKGHSATIASLAVYGDRLVSSSLDQTIKVWDLSSIGKKKSFVDSKWFDKSWIEWLKNNHPDIDINKSEDIEELYRRLVKEKDEYAYKLLVPLKVYPIISLFITKKNEYVAWTNEGFFTASKRGGRYVGYHINKGASKEAEYVTVDALYNSFYRPDLIQKALNGDSLKRYAKNINIHKLLQDGLAPEVHILTKRSSTKQKDIALKLQVCPKNGGGYDNLALLINDTPVSIIDTSRALKLKKRSTRDDCFIYYQTITLINGINNISFKATNKAGNIESQPDFLKIIFNDTNLKKDLGNKLSEIIGKQHINNLHILAIAVNEYKDKELQLKYSVNDADAMLKTIRQVAKPLFKKVYTYKLFDKQVTKENIKKIFEDIQSTRQDVFLLYIAGHGVTDEYNGNYYFIPYDFVNKDDEKAVQSQGIGQKELMLGLSRIKALKSLVLLDTCNAGSFVEANMQKTTTNRLARATGRAIISASLKNQVALEGYKGHGVFTYTLIEALKGKGYKNDRKITINELNEYVEKILPDRTYRRWGYRQIPQSGMYGIDFNIGMK